MGKVVGGARGEFKDGEKVRSVERGKTNLFLAFLDLEKQIKKS